MEPKKTLQERMEKNDNLEILEQRTLDNLVSFIRGTLGTYDNFDSIKDELDQLREVTLIDAIKYIKEKTNSTYSFLQDQFFVEENFDVLLKIKNDLSLSSQEYLVDGIKNIRGGGREGWEFQKKYIETFGETTEFQDLLISANDKKEGVGIDSRKYNIGAGTWSEPSPVFFYGIENLKNYTPRQLENYIYKHTSNNFLHRYEISVTTNEEGEAFLDKIQELTKKEKEKNPLISMVVNDGNYIEKEKVDLNFTNDLVKIIEILDSGVELKFYEKDYKDDYDTYSYEIKDGKDYEYIDDSTSWSEITEDNADYYSMVKSENNDWFFYPNIYEAKKYKEVIEAEKEAYLENSKRKLEHDLKLINEHSQQITLNKNVNKVGIPVLD